MFVNQQLLNDALAYARPQIYQGEVATYIPELAKANPQHLGACVMTTDGECLTAGDWEQEFSIQSIGKTISLILALQLVGREKVFSKVGVEPSGDAFNSMVKLETVSAVPFNPMINAGAISTVGCSMGQTDDVYEAFLALARKLCNCDKIRLDHDTYQSESATGMRNRAMAYFMQNADVLEWDVEETVDVYFKMCGTLANTKALAHYALVLANNGKHPVTGEVLVEDWIVRIVKTVMLTCGMYDGSGEFALSIGLPGKSGVGGGIITCAENKMGIATFAPALDPKGNSLGGLLILEHLSNQLDLHLFSGNVSYKN